MIRGAVEDRGRVHDWREAHSVRARRASLRLFARSGDDPRGVVRRLGLLKALDELGKRAGKPCRSQQHLV